MRQFLDELNELKGAHRKIKKRRRVVRTFVLKHYVSLSLSLFIGALALFAFLNTDAPWKWGMLALDCASLVLVCWLLFSGIER